MAAIAWSCLPGGVVVVAGLQELVDVVFAALRDGVDPPVPERRRPPVGLVRRRRGGARRWPRPSSGARNAAGPGPRAGTGDEQPGGPGRGHRGGQAVRRVDGRPQLLGQVGLVAGVLLARTARRPPARSGRRPARSTASLMACWTRRMRAWRSGSGGRSAGWPTWKTRAVSSTGTR